MLQLCPTAGLWR